jgi:hypothetical protein
MGFQKLPGNDFAPNMPRIHAAITTLSANAVADATGEMVAIIGSVIWNDADTSKSITKVGFRFGTVVKAGGSGLTLSLQDVNLTSTPPLQPDEVQDQTYAITNGNASFASNTYLHSGALSANRTVNYGSLLAVVIEFDGGGRLGSDSFIISGQTNVDNNNAHRFGVALKASGAWGTSTCYPNVVLEFTDGTFGTLGGCWPFQTITSLALKSDSTPDEWAQLIKFPYTCKVRGCWLPFGVAAATSDFDIVLYDSDGNSILTSRSIDANALVGASSVRYEPVWFPVEVTLLANTTYYLAVKPTQATSTVTVYACDVSAAGHLQAHYGGTDWCAASRSDGGVWTPSTSRRIFAGVQVSSILTGGANPLNSLLVAR